MRYKFNNKLTKPLKQSLNLCKSATFKAEKTNLYPHGHDKRKEDDQLRKSKRPGENESEKGTSRGFSASEDDVVVRKKVTPGFLTTQSIFFSWNKFYIRRSSQLFYYNVSLTEPVFLQVKEIKESVTK